MHAKISNQRSRKCTGLPPIGRRIRQLREAKELSQGDIERRTGLLRCYISRVENGHTIPSLETLEKFASAVEVPLYRFFYESKEAPIPLSTSRGAVECLLEAENKAGPQARFIRKFGKLCRRIADADRTILLALATKLIDRHEGVVEQKSVTALAIKELKTDSRLDRDLSVPPVDPVSSTHQSTRMLGTIGKVIHDHGFGFIRTSKGWEVIFHDTSLEQLNFHTLKEGQPVEFELQPGNGGKYPRAAVVRAWSLYPRE